MLVGRNFLTQNQIIVARIAGQVPSMSPSGSIALSGPMSSCRASPGSFPEFSNNGDAGDDLRFSSRFKLKSLMIYVNIQMKKNCKIEK